MGGGGGGGGDYTHYVDAVGTGGLQPHPDHTHLPGHQELREDLSQRASLQEDNGRQRLNHSALCRVTGLEVLATAMEDRLFEVCHATPKPRERGGSC